ncbi:serine protease gd-like isoform X2 [Homalodisca vitripennis]|uniref:serine protease gd-like isoform X2 n=1 Tax=Homalodisca vitripennis TaxID=197043 RepID=UPI001EECD1CD|nr:serine protease gd-like isoform X2 [Homalodisca vitripennis]
MAGTMFLGTLVNGLARPQIPESPCPQVFQYQSHTVPGDSGITVTGLITVISPPIGTMLYLLVHLQLQAVLPSKYVGLVEVADKSNLTAGNLSSALMYRVRFPLVTPLPTVRHISINSQVICTGPQDPGGECGIAVTANPLVLGGRLIKRGEWPWLAAVFVVNSLGLEFHCSGSIITRSYILTVGHCIRDEDTVTKKPSEVVVYLGKFNLQQWEEPHSVIKQVSEIHIHPDFDPTKYTADVALLQLKTLIDYSMFIQPVCLWSEPPQLDLIVGRVGTVVGWGKDNLGNKMSPTPRLLEIPIVSTEECVGSHSEFFFLTSSTTLCAGAKDGVGPCNGDSGGGLMLPVKDSLNVTRWQLRGLVTSIFRTPSV